MCSSDLRNSDNVTICEKDECIDEDEVKDLWSVEITLEDSLIIPITPDEIASEVSDLSGIEVKELTIGIEYDKDGFIKRIIVYVKEEGQAKSISESVNSIDKSGPCEGVLCRSEKATVHQKTRLFSLSSSCCCRVSAIVLLFFIFFVIINC